MAICLGSIFMIFVVELIAFRWGTAVLAKVGLKHDPHGHGLATGAHAAHGPESQTLAIQESYPHIKGKVLSFNTLEGERLINPTVSQ